MSTREVEITINGQRFLLCGEVKSGRASVLRFSSRCAECGAPFEQTARGSNAGRGYLTRRCPAHRVTERGAVTEVHVECFSRPPDLDPHPMGRQRPLSGARWHEVRSPEAGGADDVAVWLKDGRAVTVRELVQLLVREGSMGGALYALGLGGGRPLGEAATLLRDAGWIGPANPGIRIRPTSAALAALRAPAL